jgi:hypothetical protein
VGGRPEAERRRGGRARARVLVRQRQRRTPTLVYVYWEPTNARSLPLFDEHRTEVERFGKLVDGDPTCRFVALSYSDHWRELDDVIAKPEWLDRHLGQLRHRYEIEI